LRASCSPSPSRCSSIWVSGRAVEAAGDCSTLLLDKTGTITYGNRMAAEFLPVGGVAETELAQAALASSLADETPEGRSIVEFAETRYGLADPGLAGAGLVPFSAQTRMSGIGLQGRRLRKGAAESVRRWVAELGGVIPADLAPIVKRITAGGGTPLVVADGTRVLGVIHLKDTVKQGMAERFGELRDMGIRTVMITGDNPLTAAAIAREAGVDDFLAEATPIVLALAIAGSLAGARVHARTRATLDTAGPTFVVFLLGVIVIVGGLIYFPMLILGPIGERIVG
jgi:K+-transporting ATPase ATPase B chain